MRNGTSALFLLHSISPQLLITGTRLYSTWSHPEQSESFLSSRRIVFFRFRKVKFRFLFYYIHPNWISSSFSENEINYLKRDFRGRPSTTKKKEKPSVKRENNQITFVCVCVCRPVLSNGER